MRKICFLFFTYLISWIGLAQSGHIKGVIIDDNGINISGAKIYIEGLNKESVSDFNGKFTLINIPEGTSALKVRCLGFSEIKQEVHVVLHQTTLVTLVLNLESIQLDDVNIISYSNSKNAKALNTQKNNINITNVISTDQIGKFPDANIGDAVKRISGITIQVDQGEARDIIVRGLSPQLNSVTLNGSRIPSAEGDNRNIQMDLIPSDMIQTIEVSKAVTPDMDADALGGSVNLITQTSPQGFRFSTTLGSGINFIRNKRIWNGSFLVGDRSKNKKFGWMLSASINDNAFGSHNIEAEWSDSFAYNTGVLDAEGAPILENVEVNPFTSILEQQTHVIQRIRRSFAANFNYQFNNNHSIFLKTIYNWRDDRENRYVFENEILSGSDIEIEDFTITNGSLVRFPVEVSRQIRGGIDNNRNKNSRLEDQRIQNYNLGGNHLFGDIKLDWMTSFAKASEESKNERIAEFKSEYSINNDNSNPEFPIFIPITPTDANNLSSFLFEEITEENKHTEEEDINFFANIEIPYSFFKKENGFLKFGTRARLKSKFRENDFSVFDLSDTFPTLIDVPNRDYSNPDYLVGSQYQVGVFPDERWLGRLLLEKGESVPGEFLKQNFTVEENVFAGYALANQKITDKLHVLGGLRIEHTTVRATANQARDEKKQSYTNILPGLHFKYNLSPQTILRLAWTNTLARPNYVDLVPTLDIVFEDRAITIGNPNLKSTTSINFDLMGEHYFKSVGIISTGIFYKKINDFIYTFRSETTDDRFGVGTRGFNLFQPLNGDGASLIGIELAFQRQLDFLSGFAKNFSIDVNYTYLTSNADGIRDENGVERKDLDLPDTAPHLFNGSLGYKGKKFNARLSVNFSDAYIDEIGRNAFRDIYYDKQFFLDFNAGYNLDKNISIYWIK